MKFNISRASFINKKGGASDRGFTLIELMVVVAIIAIMTGIIITSLVGSKAKSRDATRVSNLNQIQLALEQYFSRCGQYPLSIADTSANNGCPATITLGSYISVIPKDPNGASFDYVTNVGANVVPTDYVIHTSLEGQNAAQQNSYPNSLLTGGFGAQAWSCYDGTTPYPAHLSEYCVSTK